MFSWLKRRLPLPPRPVEVHEEPQRIMANGKRSRYAPKDDPQRFVGDPPPLRLVPYGDGLTLCEDSTGLLVGPTDRRLAKVGIYVAKLRGESYYKAACRRGDFSPEATVRLVPEPDNKHDPHAVAVTADDDEAKTAAYISKGHAKRFERLLASGEPLRVIAIRGTGAGTACEKINVLAGHPDLVAHLLSPRPEGLPKPQTR